MCFQLCIGFSPEISCAWRPPVIEFMFTLDFRTFVNIIHASFRDEDVPIFPLLSPSSLSHSHPMEQTISLSFVFKKLGKTRRHLHFCNIRYFSGKKTQKSKRKGNFTVFLSKHRVPSSQNLMDEMGQILIQISENIRSYLEQSVSQYVQRGM